MKKVENLVSMLILFIITGITAIIFYERHYTSKFSNTEIPVSFKTFKENWGEPDIVMQYNKRGKTVFYYTILNEFVFNVNEKGIVEFKYKDNF
ncbi:hypothetical protein [Moheibacter sediminis]|uniref:Uncharacterized protein n=1 Tax=Moheibacter sediminis TaxID=1434700 RepID=A0A1W1YIP0_9FLAO|nr:hypothetical protein [Moheibacter sediminis]SMC36045.1 hypothetical protein SAMN06296427_101426 [Moheibacter sediminis]